MARYARSRNSSARLLNVGSSTLTPMDTSRQVRLRYSSHACPVARISPTTWASRALRDVSASAALFLTFHI